MMCNCRTCTGDKVQAWFNTEIFQSLCRWHGSTVHLSLECSDTQVEYPALVLCCPETMIQYDMQCVTYAQKPTNSHLILQYFYVNEISVFQMHCAATIKFSIAYSCSQDKNTGRYYHP